MKRALAIATLALGAVVTAFTAAPAGAQTELVTDYANYPATPQAQLPAGCDGGGLFHSEQFALNGGAPVHDPHDLPAFNAGDTITMTWDATTPQCVRAPVVLVIKVAHSPTFHLSDEQVANLPYAVTIATGGPQSLSFELPSLERFGFGCAYQLDAIVGLPLAVVGPGGSDYSPGNRAALGQPGSDDRTTVIAYRNGAYEACEAPTTTTTVPETTTTAPPETTTTAPPTTTTEPAPTTTAPAATTTPETLRVALPPATTTPAPHSVLATTGRNTSDWAWAGVFLLAAGVILLAGRRFMTTRGVRR